MIEIFYQNLGLFVLLRLIIFDQGALSISLSFMNTISFLNYPIKLTLKKI